MPEDFPLASMANDAERLVVTAFRDRLTDGWLILPDVGLRGDRDRQLDIVLAHEREGIALVEVKGHAPRIEQGIWMTDGSPMEPQPFSQAQDNAYALRRRLRSADARLERIRIEYAVAFPNTSAITGSLPPDIDARQVLTIEQLIDPTDAIESLMSVRWGGEPLGRDGLDAVLRILRPDAILEWESAARSRLARLRLDAMSDDQLRALESLDLNRRVVVRGAAGTGKSALARAWTRRALLRGERAMLVCFNLPLADVHRERFATADPAHVTVGGFFEVALGLDGLPPLPIPDDADADWWDNVAIGHLHRHWHQVTERFDTIVVDEAQDFSPAWIAQLEQLLRPDGPRRMMLLVDEQQGVYRRGFVVPSADDGWTHCELVDNCRNTFGIATLLRRQFGGAHAPIGGPETEDVRWVEIAPGDADSASAAVIEWIDLVVEERDTAPVRLLVATVASSVRDRLREEHSFVAWESRDEYAILCENVHRVKGLEFDHVALVLTDPEVADELLYVGASRAVMSLTVIAPASVARRLGLTTD